MNNEMLFKNNKRFLSILNGTKGFCIPYHSSNDVHRTVYVGVSRPC